MATPRKDPSSYPAEFSQLLFRAVSEPQVISFKDHKTAVAFRKQLYAFRNSLEETPEFNIELLLVAQKATFSVEDTTCTVTIPEMPSLEDFK